MGALQLVIFDCDGVLVDSEPISNRVLAQMLSDEGLPITTEQARETFQGLRLDGLLAEAEQRLGRKLPRDFVQDYEQQRAQAFRRELRPVIGAAEAVTAVLAAGVPVCVASQGKLQKTALSLQLTGLDDLFPIATRFSAHTVPHGKPHPALFEHAAAAMGADPSHCAVVEDTPSGVTAAIAACMRALGYAADSDADALREAGAEVMDSLHELPRRLELG
jgi:HAD superfamily hydrolase (TIGR01509 family)